MNFSFKTKIMLLSAGITLAAGIAALIVAIISSRQALRNQIQDQLLSQGQTIKSTLTHHQEKLKIFARQVSDSRLIEGMFIAFEGSFYGTGLVAGQDVANYKLTFDSGTQNLMARSKVMALDYDFSDIVLVATSGQVVFALTDDSKPNPILGKNMDNGVLKNSKLGHCYQKAKSNKSGEVFYSGYEVSPLYETVTGYLCLPKFSEFDHSADGVKKGDLLGVILLQIDQDKINQVTLKIYGMGETGVAYTVGSDKKLRTDYHKASRELSLKESISNSGTLHSEAIDQVNAKKEGIAAIEDPFGLQVISSYSEFDFFDEPWGVIVEKEQDEIFAPVKRMVWTLSLTGIIAFGAVSVLGFFYLTKMVNPLVQITETLGGSSEAIASASDVLTASSRKLSEGAMSAATSLQQTVSSLDEISSIISANSKNADESFSLAQENNQSASKGSEQIHRLIETMREVASKAAKVEEITVVIEDIAFQTNLLALNASVEAARAGEQGKGFAVVADAVRALAQKAAQATQEINDLIKTTVEVANRGRDQADHSGQVLDGIVNSFPQTSNLSQQIAQASRQQATGIQEINKAMNTIDMVTQSNAGSANQVEENSSTLETEAVRLKQASHQLVSLIHGETTGIGRRIG